MTTLAHYAMPIQPDDIRVIRINSALQFAQAARSRKLNSACRYWLDIALEAATCYGMGATSEAIGEAIKTLDRMVGPVSGADGGERSN